MEWVWELITYNGMGLGTHYLQWNGLGTHYSLWNGSGNSLHGMESSGKNRELIQLDRRGHSSH